MQLFIRMRTNELVSLLTKKFSLRYLRSTVCDNRKIVNFQNEVAKLQNCVDSNANYLFNYLFLLTPDPLQQYSALRVLCEFNYLKERCRKRSRKLTFVERN